MREVLADLRGLWSIFCHVGNAIAVYNRNMFSQGFTLLCILSELNADKLKFIIRN